ncbi:MAG TPA: cytochrome c [Methylomirabilota bacterium]|nr:cytochrome c [Methylomirabilota bacterium]
MTMKRVVIALLIAAVAAAVGVLLLRQVLHDGVSAKAEPTGLEKAVAARLRHLAIPADARSRTNPVPASPQAVREGMLHFADHCATCHGNDGGGDTLYGRGLYPKPPDMRTAHTQELSDGELFWIIENGVRFTGMPAFSSHGEEDASWRLVRFIRHLPQLTAAERLEMQRTNPKSPDDLAEEKEEQEFLEGKSSGKQEQKAHHH